MPAWRMDKGATNQCNGPTMAYQPQPLLCNALYYVANQSTNQPTNQPTPTPSACNLPVNNCWGNSKFQVLGWRNIHDELQQNWEPVWVYRITLEKRCPDIIHASSLNLNTWLKIIWTCFWEKFRYFKSSKTKRPKTDRFLASRRRCCPIWKTNAGVTENILPLYGTRALGFVEFLKSCVSCQALAEAVKQNSTLTSVAWRGNNIGPEGAKAWCLVRMGPWGEWEWSEAKERSRHRRMKVTLGKWRKAIQHSVESQMCHISRANLSELEIALSIIFGFWEPFQERSLVINRKLIKWCKVNERLAGHRINDEPALVVSSGLAA